MKEHLFVMFSKQAYAPWESEEWRIC